jgi:DNA invertase Pin-like site-specific DNA recombinase
VKSEASPHADSDTRQRAAIEAYAASCGMTVAAEFYDDAVPGTDPIEIRRGFAEMIERCAADGVNVILVENASRFARDLIVQELGLRTLGEMGVEVVPCDAPQYFRENADNPSMRLVRKVLGAVPEYEKSALVIKHRGARMRKRAISEPRTLTGQRKCEGGDNLAVLAPDAVVWAGELKRQGLSLRVTTSLPPPPNRTGCRAGSRARHSSVAQR